MNDTVTKLMALADEYANAVETRDVPLENAARQALQDELVRLFTPLTDERILSCGVEHQMFFARGCGSAPSAWSNEQVRTCPEFTRAFVGFAKSVLALHGITGEKNEVA